MPPRVAFIHTVGSLIESFRGRMRSSLPDVDAFHVLDESLLQDLLRGAPERDVHRRLVGQVLLAVDAGAGLVVVTCSSTSPGVDAARRLTSTPVLKIDDPMAAQAARTGGRIALLCTATSTVEPSSALIEAHADSTGTTVDVRPIVVSEAYDALLAGDRDRHDRLVVEAARGVRAEADLVVLAQASLAPLREAIAAQLPMPVLASPDLLMTELAERCAGPSGPRS